MGDLFERLCKISHKTKDRLIIWDKLESKAYVMMDLDEYENYLDQSQDQKKVDLSKLSEEEMLNEITRQIQAWNQDHKKKETGVSEIENHFNHIGNH